MTARSITAAIRGPWAGNAFLPLYTEIAARRITVALYGLRGVALTRFEIDGVPMDIAGGPDDPALGDRMLIVDADPGVTWPIRTRIDLVLYGAAHQDGMVVVTIDDEPPFDIEAHWARLRPQLAGAVADLAGAVDALRTERA